MKPLKWTRHSDLAIERRACVDRQEYLDYMTFVRNDRPLFTEIFGPLIGLKEEWEQQGASQEELAFSAFEYCCEHRGWLPVHTGWMGGPETRVLQETDEYVISLDHMGRRVKLLKGFATLPLPLDFPVRNMEDWEAVRHHLEWRPDRVREDWRRLAAEHLTAGRVICVGIPGGFDIIRELMGDEAACLAFYDQPELIEDILKTVGDTAVKCLDAVSAGAQIDLLHVHEDMAGKSGPMIGPALVREFILQYYRRVWDMLASRGARVFEQDSDGNMNAVIDAFLEAGVNSMYPMEPAAGMDVVRIREKYGRRLAFVGGIDKHVLRRSRAEIAAELEYKIPPLVATGGAVLALDHRIPNGTPLENYRFYIAKAWEIMEREAARLGGRCPPGPFIAPSGNTP